MEQEIQIPIENKRKPKRIPKLRFKEFDEEWVKNRLGRLINIKSGQSPSSYTFKNNGLFPFFKVEELNNSYKFQKVSRFYSDDDQNIIKKNSVLFPKRGAAILNNKVRITSVDSHIDSNLMAIAPNSNLLNYEFLYYKIYSEKLYKIADTSTIPQINNKHIEPYIINLPDLKEQQKIATFLSAVDKKIQQLTRKKELLESYKKGVMQQLFSQKLRFKDENGKNFPEWEEKRLGEIAKFLKGKGISKSDITEDGFIKCIRYGELYTIYKETINIVHSKTNVPEEELVFSQKGDVIIPSSGETQLDIAKASCVMDEKIALGGDLNIIRSKISGVFLAYYLNGALKYEIAKLSQGVSVVHLYSSQLKTLKMTLPSPQEQQKIADFLSGIDIKIESVSQQITNTENFKKGLLQQMFV